MNAIQINRIIKLCFFLIFIASITTIKLNANASTNINTNKNEIVSNDSLNTTYIANEGFFISYCGKKILIDALFPLKNSNFLAPTDELLNKMETAQPPFDNIDMILATHIHPDHFNPKSVTQCLIHNPNSVLISTPHAAQFIAFDSVNYSKIKHQVKAEKLNIHESTIVSYNGIKVQIFRTYHSNNNTRDQNYMYLITINDKKIFHEGDSENSLETFKKLGLDKESIDIALVHGWFAFEPETRKIINEYLKPNQIVLMHIPKAELDSYFNRIDEIKKYFPNVTIFRNSMEHKYFK